MDNFGLSFVRYDEVLGSELTDQIQTLYEMAVNMDTDSVEIILPNWEEERETYIDNGGVAAGEMATVIAAMESAMEENASQDVRQQAIDILTTQQTSLPANIDSCSEQIEEAQQQEERNRTNLENAERRLRNRPDDADPTPYQNAVDNAATAWERSVERLDTLQQQKQSYENALRRVNYYADLLGMAEEGVDSYYIGTNLREIQGELLQAEPDLDQIRNTAIEIFERLQSAENLGTDNGAAYQEFISLINGFIRNLKKSTQLKSSGEELQQLMDKLAAGELLLVEGGTDGWAEDWEKAFHELKFKISGLPVYNGDLSALPDEDFLRFDRSESTRALDRTVEQYLTKHNAAEEGLIYLFSDYNEMAVFSLILAILLDLAAFVTGIVIEREESKLLERTREHSDEDSRRNTVFLNEGERMQAKSRCLNQYLFLTGDYICQEGQYIYRTIEQGEEGQIDLTEAEKSIGLYLQKGKTLQSVWSLKSTATKDAKLLYKVDTNGPADGVYKDCEISYEEGLLYIDQNGTKSFLGNVDSKMPVYKLTAQTYDVILASELKKLHGQMIVVALDREGLQIAAVYIMPE